MNTQILFLICGLIGSSVAATRNYNKMPTTLRPRFVDSFSTSFVSLTLLGTLNIYFVACYLSIHSIYIYTNEFFLGQMTEEIEGVPTTTAAAPQCTGSLGWVYNNGYCYMFTSYHVDYLKAEELCNQEGAYLADVLSNDENNFIKGVLNVINPKDGTDYWLGGLDADRDKGLQWMTGISFVYAIDDILVEFMFGNLLYNLQTILP